MGKFKHDGSSVDTSKGGGYDGEQPPPGTYNAVLVTCEEHQSQAGAEGTHWVFEFVDEPYKGFRGHVYTNDAGALWKQDQILYATGMISPGGTYEGSHEQIVKKAQPVRVKTKYEKYEDENRCRINTILPGGTAPAGAGPGAKPKKKKAGDDAPF
jgi:hypothetical protein